MKQLLFVAAALAFVTPAIADETASEKDGWVSIGTTDEGSEFFVNLEELARRGWTGGDRSARDVRIWTMTDDSRNKRDEWRQTKSLMKIDCVERTVRSLQTTFYYPDGKTSINRQPTQPSYPSPGSPGAWLVEFACDAAADAE